MTWFWVAGVAVLVWGGALVAWRLRRRPAKVRYVVCARFLKGDNVVRGVDFKNKP